VPHSIFEAVPYFTLVYIIWSHQNCLLLGYYKVSSDIFLPTFRDNLSHMVPKCRHDFTSTRRVTTQKNTVLIYFAA